MSLGPWSAGLPAFLWQVVLHSAVTGFLFHAWARHVGLPSGRARQRLLAVVLVLPLVTAAVPGRAGPAFHQGWAWLDSGRVLAVPLMAGVRVQHVALLVGLLTAALTLWQEVLPPLRRRRTPGGAPPRSLEERVHRLPGWGHCAVGVAPGDGIHLATGGRRGRPWLLVSRGALDGLSPEELHVALLHEHAHWQAGRWTRSHALFLVRLLQPHNPVALWAFREHCLEVEIECDAAAVAGGDARVLARTLLKTYEATDRRDVVTRSALRKRVEVLLDRGGLDDHALPASTIAVASAILLLVLPWLV